MQTNWFYNVWPFLGGAGAIVMVALLMTDKFRSNTAVSRWLDLVWLMWLAVHLFYITGFKNQVTALLHWAVTFIGNDRSERTATEQQIFAREALGRLDRGANALVSAPDNTPTRAELAHGLSGNLCRCADYNKILNSMLRAAEYLRRT